ncbi:MAG TPA: formimidoylglutamate deiminase [Bryobacteraceae bacterium]
MTKSPEQGWLPDFLYRDGRFESGVALFANAEGRIQRLSRSPEDLKAAQRLNHQALLPGLVNAHSHSFQRALRARTERRTRAGRDTFWTWREAMYHAANSLSPEDIYRVARMAFLEMLASGITTVGEFHYLHHAPGGTPYENRNLLAEKILCAARETGLRIALLRTAYSRAGFQKPLNPGQVRFMTPNPDDFISDTEALRTSITKGFSPDRAWVGIAPHSIRAVHLPYIERVASYAAQNGLVLHMHVAEQQAEIEACQTEFGLRPIELLYEHGVLSERFTGVHVIHVNEREIDYLAKARAHVCACATTERNLGDGIAPAERWAALSIPVCYGSDSNIQIDLWEDARELEYHLRLEKLERAVLAPDAERESLSRRLFDSATRVGAESLGAPAGSLEPGLAADFLTVDLDDLSIAGADAGSLLSHIVFSLERTAIRQVCVGGEPVIQDGRHPLQEEIVREFRETQQKLWEPA